MWWQRGLYLLRVLTAFDLSHYVEGVGIRQGGGSHGEIDHDLLFSLCHTRHQLCILHRDAGRRDALHSFLVVLPTCVGTEEGDAKTEAG